MAYAGTTLKQLADLETVASDSGPKKVPVRCWPRGSSARSRSPPGRSASPSTAARPAKSCGPATAAEQVLLGMRGGAHQRLPGIRREVEAVARLFPAGTVTTVVGAQACEATVQALAHSGRMKAFRYLHFAAHGVSARSCAYRTGLILAP